jgi:arylsulfatase A-like enzyme/Flp pilus assembly protein TadD
MGEKLRQGSILRLRRILLVLVAGACFGWLLARVTVLRKEVRSIVVISIDTCRADHLSCYGFGRQTTPNIDAIAEEGVLFENVIAPVPLTLPSHSSMLTGTIPPYHGVRNNDSYKLGQSNVTLAEILGDNGFTTGAFISAFVMDSRFGLDQGFDTYGDEFEQRADGEKKNERRGEDTSRLAVEWLEEHRGEKFFLFCHYFDPHNDYEPPEPFASRFADNLYAGEIAYTDYCIGQVIEKLKRLGLYKSTLLVITGDHGEMRGEHGESTHSFFIYQSAVKVPLIIKPAGKTKAQRIESVVGLVDIVSTICSVLGIETPSPVQGENLSGYFGGGKGPGSERYLYCESLLPTIEYNANGLRGVVGNRWKYIETTRVELYDLVEDAGETNNLAQEHGQQVRILSNQLKQIVGDGADSGKSDSRLAMDEETRRRLESLGYFGSASIIEDFGFDERREDPKDLIGFHANHAAARYYFTREDYGRSKEYCERMLLERPDYPRTYLYLGLIAFTEDRIEETVSHLLHYTSIDPNQIRVLFTLGVIFEQQGKLDRAVEHYSKALEIDPEIAAGQNNLGNILFQLGRYEEAIIHCTKALEIKPELAAAHYVLGNIRLKQGDLDKAIMRYEKALLLQPGFREAQNNLSLARSLKEEP